ncbi:Severin [Pleurostoma richardsiae]|uniref:Severin n=1 Tax=Pleurostoma richardsiae TaxID=41990 RepID=A0AA38S2A5_9PEZI|nr:Severin [Pleurostoma richardsiae]
MAPHAGLVHLKEYDIKDSNVELIGSNIDHKVKHASAASEPAWNDGRVGVAPGLFVWRIEDFEVVAWPREQYGRFYDGDSFIVLRSRKVGTAGEQEKLAHDVFFWLGAHTSQDEAGTAAYKTVELDEFLGGAAVQHRELQQCPSDEFVSLFPRLEVRSGGVRSGFRHVEREEGEPITTLLRVSKHASGSVVVVEVEPTWESLDEEDVFVLDKGDKIWVWQGSKCSPMEKAKAAQVVHDMTIAKHVDVEVLSQNESRSHVIVRMLGGEEAGGPETFRHSRPVASTSDRLTARSRGARPRRLFRLSDASGMLSFELASEGAAVSKADLDGSDVFILDDGEREVWVWQGLQSSRAEKASWLKVAQAYVRRLQQQEGDEDAYLIPIAKVLEGSESPAFTRAISV